MFWKFTNSEVQRGDYNYRKLLSFGNQPSYGLSHIGIAKGIQCKAFLK